jgi:hypothetical protein
MEGTKEKATKDFIEYISQNSPESVILNGLDHGIVGMDVDGHVVYSYEKCVEILMERDGMTLEEAEEWLDYNTVRAIPYMGDMRPVMMYEMERFES